MGDTLGLWSVEELHGQITIDDAIEEIEAELDQAARAVEPETEVEAGVDGALFGLRLTTDTSDGALFGLTI